MEKGAQTIVVSSAIEENKYKTCYKSSYREVSFDQFPMKSGILPVSSLSEAHLRWTATIAQKNNDSILFFFYFETTFQDILIKWKNSQNILTL